MEKGVDCWRSFAISPGLLLDIGGTVCFSLLQWSSVVVLLDAVPCEPLPNLEKLWKFADVSSDLLTVRSVYTVGDTKLLFIVLLPPFT